MAWAFCFGFTLSCREETHHAQFDISRELCYDVIVQKDAEQEE